MGDGSEGRAEGVHGRQSEVFVSRLQVNEVDSLTLVSIQYKAAGVHRVRSALY